MIQHWALRLKARELNRRCRAQIDMPTLQAASCPISNAFRGLTRLFVDGQAGDIGLSLAKLGAISERQNINSGRSG
jgi:hypothetical protein